MSKPSEIWLADAIRAWVTLDAELPVRFDIARLLLRRSATPAVERRPRPSKKTTKAVDRRTALHPVRSQSEPQSSRPEAGTAQPYQLSRYSDTTPARRDVAPLPPPVPRSASHISFEPLFRAQWTRGIVGAAISSKIPDGPLDVAAMTDRIARGELLSGLRRESRTTMRRGLQVLVDESPAMGPFARDAAEIVRRLRSYIGGDTLQIAWFTGSPSQIYRGTSAEPATYRPPLPGTPVLVLSDFGMAPARAWGGMVDWVEFAAALHRRRCPLIGFVPYSRARWPEALVGLVTFVRWDRRTNAAMVHRAIQRGRKRLRDPRR